MNVKELKEMLEGLPDNVRVLGVLDRQICAVWHIEDTLDGGRSRFLMHLQAFGEVYLTETEKALFMAIKEGNLEEVKRLINDERIDINIQDNSGENLVLRAIKYNHTEIVRFLLEKGADVSILSPAYFKFLITVNGINNRNYDEMITLLKEAGINEKFN